MRKSSWNHIASWALLGLLILGSGKFLQAQSDSLPQIVEGELNWSAFKAELQAPTFNQKDLVMYLVRQQGLAAMLEDEVDQNWVDDFHFVDFDKDQNLDAVFCSYLREEAGYRTMVFHSDSILSYPKVMSMPGYLHAFNHRRGGAGMLIRKDANAAIQMTTISSLDLDYASDSLDTLWQVQILPGTKVPPMVSMEAFPVQEPIEMRLSPEINEKEAFDLDGDGKVDVEGNAIAVLNRGVRVIRMFQEVTGENETWSFVICIDAPEKGHRFAPLPFVPTYFAGWIPSEVIED